MLSGTLTYKPKACPCCGAVNSTDYVIIKNGSKHTQVLSGQYNFMPIILNLKKQRFCCKTCTHTFIATTSLISKYCTISHPLQALIIQELTEFQSFKLIGQHLNVSSTTVIRSIRRVANPIKQSYRYLPQHLSFDEFKSVKDVSNVMSFSRADAHTHRLIDIVEDSKKNTLQVYFNCYPTQAKTQVKTITIDMYSPYLELIKSSFPNAKIIIGRFHIVQYRNRTLNHTRIQLMKALKNKQAADYRKYKARNIKEELHQIVFDALNQVIDEKESYIKITDSIISKILVDDYDKKVERLNDKLRTLQENLILAANQDKDYDKIADHIFELRTKQEKMLIENVANQEKRRRLVDIKAHLKTYEESLVTGLVEQILIKDESVEVTLKSGKVITVEK